MSGPVNIPLDQLSNMTLDQLSDELLLRTFLLLDLKSLVKTGTTCSKFRRLTADQAIWKPILSSVLDPCKFYQFDFEKKSAKAEFISRAVALNQDAKEGKTEKAALAQIYLSRVGLSTLSNALASADSIPNTLLVDGWTELNQQQSAYYHLCQEFIFTGRLEDAEAVLAKITTGGYKDILATQIMYGHIENTAFDNALKMLVHIDSPRTISQLVYKLHSKKAKIETIIAALQRNPAPGAIRQFYYQLIEKDDADAEIFKTSFSEILTQPQNKFDVMFHLWHPNMDKARLESAIMIADTLGELEQAEILPEIYFKCKITLEDEKAATKIKATWETIIRGLPGDLESNRKNYSGRMGYEGINLLND